MKNAMKGDWPGWQRFDLVPVFGDPIGPWRSWFAWRPVNTVERGWRWLCFVQRRRVQLKAHLPGAMDWWWQYRC